MSFSGKVKGFNKRKFASTAKKVFPTKAPKMSQAAQQSKNMMAASKNTKMFGKGVGP